MDEAIDIRISRDDVDQLFRKIPRIRRNEGNFSDLRKHRHCLKQKGEKGRDAMTGKVFDHDRLHRSAIRQDIFLLLTKFFQKQIGSIGIHILAEQHDLLRPVPYRCLHFIQDFFERSGALFPA